MKILLIVLSILPLLAASLHAAAPEVSNLSASQRAGTKLVDITYDVSADTPTVTISLEVSSDGGATFTVPATSLSGAIGEDVAVGAGKTITWDAGADWNQQSSSTMRFKVVADDGLVSPEFVEVAAGTLPESSWAGAQAVDAFYMAKTEVTWAQFQEVRTWAAANGYDIGSVGSGMGPNYPVTNVSWYQSLKWCNARSEKDGLDPVYKTGGAVYRSGDSVPTVDATANGYRLPSEKEWEFAARGGVQTNGYEYSGSNDINTVAWYSSNSGSSTQDAATKQANELGIHDMSGNVYEWCFDLYSGTNRVCRGGSCYNVANYCRVAYRVNINPTASGSNFGFRVARSLIEQPEFVEVAAGTLPESSDLGAQAVDAFYMAKTEVTWAQFQEVRTWAAANGYDIGSVGDGTGPNRPVTNVNWYQSLKWCNARSEKEGLDPVYKVDGAVYQSGESVPTVDATANGYRLPSEKEWEFAARGGVQTNGYEYSGSDDINAVAWYLSNSGGSTQDVATKQANELGIHDMSGNVSEWCFYIDIYSGTLRVGRGGTYLGGADICRVALRYHPAATYSHTFIGFRVARSLSYITDDVVVNTTNPNPSAPALSLESFYESNSGQSVTVDATPSDGYPTNFSYQWYLNGFAIPPNFGGTASNYQISGVSSNNGTWRVVVTNSTGSTEASFVYRVFIDSDADGLHDDDEVNIHGTNPNLSDTDADGLSDADEINTHQTNPNVADSDSDGLSDGDEINTHESNPLVADSSGDGLADGFVVNAGFDPNTDYSALLTANALNALGYYNNSQIVDARAGSVGIVRDGNSATLQLQIQRSEDLETWTSQEDDLISVPMDMPGNKQFFRFAIPQG